MTQIRFTTLPHVPSFTEGHLDLRRDVWTAIDTDTATPEQRDLLEQQFGRVLQVHEADAAAFRAASAPLEMFEGIFRYPVGVIGAPIGQRHAKAVQP